MTDSERRTEADAVSELAARPDIQEAPGVRLLTGAIPPEWSLAQIDMERHDPRPLRPRGTSYVHDAQSFVNAVLRRRITKDAPSPVVYADQSRNELVAVLNDDQDSDAGWRDYLVALVLRSTPEWTHWRDRDGMLLNQEVFAEHIEDGLNELVSPDSATMLEIAQSFHATTDAKFKSGTRLGSGAQQFQYEEEIKAGAGGGGTIEIPSRLELVLAPFYGSARYEVGAWFRFRLTREHFTLGYKLDRPYEVEAAAFADVRASVAEGLADVLFIAGPAPDPTWRRQLVANVREET